MSLSTGRLNSGLASFGTMCLGSPLSITMVDSRVIRGVDELYEVKHTKHIDSSHRKLNGDFCSRMSVVLRKFI